MFFVYHTGQGKHLNIRGSHVIIMMVLPYCFYNYHQPLHKVQSDMLYQNAIKIQQ